LHSDIPDKPFFKKVESFLFCLLRLICFIIKSFALCCLPFGFKIISSNVLSSFEIWLLWIINLSLSIGTLGIFDAFSIKDKLFKLISFAETSSVDIFSFSLLCKVLLLLS